MACRLCTTLSTPKSGGVPSVLQRMVFADTCSPFFVLPQLLPVFTTSRGSVDAKMPHSLKALPVSGGIGFSMHTSPLGLRNVVYHVFDSDGRVKLWTKRLHIDYVYLLCTYILQQI